MLETILLILIVLILSIIALCLLAPIALIVGTFIFAAREGDKIVRKVESQFKEEPHKEN